MNPYRVLLFSKFGYPGFAPRAVLSGPYRAVTRGSLRVFDVRVEDPAYRAVTQGSLRVFDVRVADFAYRAVTRGTVRVFDVRVADPAQGRLPSYILFDLQFPSRG